MNFRTTSSNKPGKRYHAPHHQAFLQSRERPAKGYIQGRTQLWRKTGNSLVDNAR